jgi:hypothetical protein
MAKIKSLVAFQKVNGSENSRFWCSDRTVQALPLPLSPLFAIDQISFVHLTSSRTGSARSGTVFPILEWRAGRRANEKVLIGAH